ncbi:MAG: type transport system permease protein [Oceanotoga sp.]|uniref:putative ABC transporter permease subunit n=1 Tax=Oceanotoga sp. TaxID=2108366 RepID=UPI00264D422F|nr:hypothetical protein [Oceanotoga sp.]MDN5343307.1 type transport system permease protein [Oceanotoga sp.]
MKAKKLISLISTEINSHYSISKNIYSFKNEKSQRINLIAITVAIIVSIISIIPLYSQILRSYYTVFKTINSPESLLTMASMLSGIIGIIVGMLTITGNLFLSKKNNLLLTLPITQNEIIISKLSTAYLDQIIISTIIILPTFIYYGINEKANIFFYISMIIVYLLSQIFAISLITIVSMITSGIFIKSKNKEFYILIVSFLIIISLFFISYIINQDINSKLISPQDLSNMSKYSESINQGISLYYPPVILISKIFSDNINIIWLFLYILLNISLLYLSILISKPFYFKFLKSNKGHSISNKKYKNSSLKKENSKTIALFKREWNNFMRTPSFSVNGFANILVFPIMLILFTLVFKNSDDQDIKMIQDLIKNAGNYILPIGTILAALSASINGISYSIFSREGTSFGELKIIPASTMQIINSKLIHINIFSSVPIIIVTILISYIGSFSFIKILMMFITSFSIVTTLNLIQMIVDTINPNLKWDNPQKAMKGNLNGLFAMLIVFGYCALLSFIGATILKNLSPTLLTIISLILNISISIFLYKLLLNKTQKLLSKD